MLQCFFLLYLKVKKVTSITIFPRYFPPAATSKKHLGLVPILEFFATLKSAVHQIMAPL